MDDETHEEKIERLKNYKKYLEDKWKAREKNHKKKVKETLKQVEKLDNKFHKFRYGVSKESTRAKNIAGLLEHKAVNVAKDRLVGLLKKIEDGSLRTLLEDSYELVEDSQLAEGGSDYQNRLLKKAQFTLNRFVLRKEDIADLGRVKEPIFESSQQAEIYRYLRGVDRATYKEIADYLDVSKETVRKRIKPLLDKGYVRKIDYGEGTPVEFTVER